MNTLIKKILFATDLSDTARNAFNYAVALADRFESELIVVHIIKKDMAYTAGIVRMGLGEDLYKDMEQKKAQSARDLLIGKRTEAHVFGDAFSDPVQVRGFRQVGERQHQHGFGKIK